MYDVNLIRKRIVPEKQKKVIFSVISFSALVYVLTFLGVVCFSFVNFKMIDVYAHEIDGLQDDLSVLYPGTPTHDELATMIGRVTPDLREIDGFLARRLEMAGVWESVARSLPDGVWLENVKVETEQTGAAKRKGKESKSGGIVISGYAMADRPTQSSEVIGVFTKNLEEDEVFAGFFANLKSAETGMRRAGRSSVVGFEITGDLKR